MNRRQVLLLMCLCSLMPGCSFVYYGARNTVLVPCQRINEIVLDHKNHHLAKKAWREIEKNHPRKTFSRDYRKGFIAGYDDYLDDGGNGMPPPVPPWPYRQNWKKTPEGVQASREWFAGFSHGAAEARNSGIREYQIAPTATRGPYKPPPPIRDPQHPMNFPPGNANMRPHAEPIQQPMLPQPRMLDQLHGQ